jgi:hypothetical protein
MTGRLISASILEGNLGREKAAEWPQRAVQRIRAPGNGPPANFTRRFFNSDERLPKRRLRQPDRSGDADRQVLEGMQRYLNDRETSLLRDSPECLFPARDASDLRDSSGCIHPLAASDAARSAQLHGRANHCGSCQPSAQQCHFATDFGSWVRLG